MKRLLSAATLAKNVTARLRHPASVSELAGLAPVMFIPPGLLAKIRFTALSWLCRSVIIAIKSY
jgi:hypothetical protein